MKKIKWMFLLLAVIIILSPIVNVLANPLEGYKQVTNIGGTTVNEKDGVMVSKTISESNLENYFDITLTVETTSKIEEISKAQDLAVVLVLDISNTMNKEVNSDTNLSSTDPNSRINVAKKSIKDFVSDFYKYSKDVNAVRQIGLVTFNRDSNDVFNGLVNVNSTSQDTLNNQINNITAPGVKGESDANRDVRWTNMEAGLKRANDLLNNSSVKNKYVIFLTDGLPTTYISNGYTGYTPKKAEHEKEKGYVQGNFYNFEIDKAIGTDTDAGTNYSEWGARKAEMVAYNMKNNGVKIYSIGVGITGQYTMYHLQYEKNNTWANTVDTDKELNNYSYTSTMTYNRARYYTVLPNVNKTSKNAISDGTVNTLYNDSSYYKIWLSQYIGSDIMDSSINDRKYYYDSDNKEALTEAYKKIFEDIKEMTSQEVSASWVAKDPMNTESSVKNIHFVGLYDDLNNLKDSLNINNQNESDTASYSESDDAISWDLKNSTYEETSKDSVTYYKYEIKYRVRLENELNDFKTNTNYNTNGKTYLDYIVLENKNGINVRSDIKNIEFKIPSVLGYLGNLTINKISNYNNMPLSGIKFVLTHSSNCPCMSERNHIDSNYSMEKISENGIVTFDNIPSGHKYKLQEISTDSMHEVDSNIYDVEVSYGNVITNINNNTIINKHKSKDLTIEKEVSGITTTKEFNFELSATYNNNPLVGKYTIIKNSNTSEIEFINGKITFTLKDKEKIIIKDLPLGISYNIKELDTNGFIVKYKINDNINVYNENGLGGNLDDNTSILFINTSGYELPETGSRGRLILVIIGYLLLIGPVIYIGYNFYKKGKADFQN